MVSSIKAKQRLRKCVPQSKSISLQSIRQRLTGLGVSHAGRRRRAKARSYFGENGVPIRSHCCPENSGHCMTPFMHPYVLILRRLGNFRKAGQSMNDEPWLLGARGHQLSSRFIGLICPHLPMAWIMHSGEPTDQKALTVARTGLIWWAIASSQTSIGDGTQNPWC